ncbi:MAG: type II toxin-antitoxin system RelE/ParE family toxin [Desulfuromonadales bacterium]|nr:type II toxin-antitoxin system RelE/ParE family toxin [Desulfuromonadales bacterium]
MANYKIYFRKSAAKELGKLPNLEIQKIIQRIESLAIDPRPIGCEKLTRQEFYRVRQGNYRIIYSVQDDELTVWVVRIGHRKDIYKRL